MQYHYNYWNDLDLTKSLYRPKPETLVALHMIPKSSQPTFYEEQYDIGVFRLDKSTGKKLWWHGTHGQRDPVRIRKNYSVRWCYVLRDPVA